jgi:hypothetical protein
VGPRVDQDAVEKEKNLDWESNPDYPDIQAVT